MLPLRDTTRPGDNRPGQTHRIFVDFENVPSVDLALVGEHPAEVTLLIGEKQRRLELALVRQIHEHAAKVTLVEVGASGRNALDLVLAWHLGKTVERHPDDAYFVVSRDKDYDPLLNHLRQRGLAVQRVESFASLPFLGARRPARRAVAPRRTAPAAPAQTPPARRADRAPAAPTAAPAAVANPISEDRMAKMIDRLQHRPKARPVRRKTLLSHINGFFGNQLGAGDLEGIVDTLMSRGIIALDPRGRVSYPGTRE